MVQVNINKKMVFKLAKLAGVSLALLIGFFTVTITWGLMLTLYDNQVAIIDAQGQIIELQNQIVQALTEAKVQSGMGLGIEIHCTMEQRRMINGEWVQIAYSHHAGLLTTVGKDWIEDQLGDSPSTDPAKWIGLSNSTDSPSAAWTVLPDEITTGGMGRAAGMYNSKGTGNWFENKTFSPTESNSTQLVGLYYAATGGYLLASDEITLINYQSGDSVTISWEITVS